MLGPANPTDARGVYYAGYVAVLVACFTPFKVLAHAVPAAFTAWFLVRASGPDERNRLVAVAGAAAALGGFYALVAEEFLWANFVVSLVTYSSVLPLVIIDSRLLADRALQRKILVVTAHMMLFQGIVGIVQASYGAMLTGSFAGDNGDRVAGTIYPYLEPEMAFSNPMFVVNMSVMLLACLAIGDLLGERRGHLVVAALSIVLAAVVHALVFLVAAVGLAYLWVRPPRAPGAPASRRSLIAITALVLGASYVVLPDNMADVGKVAQRAIDLDAVEIPRAVLIGRVLTELPGEAPLQPIVGLGPGQFSSRASMITSGFYLGGTADGRHGLPLIPPQATRLARDYCISLLVAFSEQDTLPGSSEQPFFSLLSIYTEVGLVGLALVLFAIGRLLVRVRARVRERPELQAQATLFCAGALFLVMLGIQDTYWEAPQAVFVSLLLLQVTYANVVHEPA